MQRVGTFFSPNQSTDRQMVDEIKCFFLHDQLLKIVKAFQDKYGTEVSNRFSQFLKQFERTLIINSRTEAVQLGEALVAAGCKAICSALKPHRTQGLLNELGIENSEQSIPFESHYITTRHHLSLMMNSPYEPEQQETYADVIIALAKCKSFSLLKDILDKLSSDACNSLQAALDTAFFYAVHFGDAEIIPHLLQHGVSPHVINLHDADRKQMPLMLLVTDLYRCVLRMQKRAQDAHNHKLIIGSLSDLENTFETRLGAYYDMITTLIERGADPNQMPDESYIHTASPREKAQDYLNTLMPELLKSEFHFKNKAIEITSLLELIAKPQPAATASADMAAQPVEKKRKF